MSVFNGLVQFICFRHEKAAEKNPLGTVLISQAPARRGPYFDPEIRTLVQLSVSISHRLYQLSAGRTNRPVKRRVPFSSFRV